VVGDVVEHLADRQNDPGVESIGVPVHPQLLLRSAHSDKDDSRTAEVDVLDHSFAMR
jgi:hypothetical protein